MRPAAPSVRGSERLERTARRPRLREAPFPQRGRDGVAQLLPAPGPSAQRGRAPLAPRHDAALAPPTAVAPAPPTMDWAQGDEIIARDVQEFGDRASAGASAGAKACPLGRAAGCQLLPPARPPSMESEKTEQWQDSKSEEPRVTTVILARHGERLEYVHNYVRLN